jgi:hypothetical protein
MPPLIGLKHNVAGEICNKLGFKVRIASLNGKVFEQPKPMVAQNRVNFHLEGGYVVEYGFY